MRSLDTDTLTRHDLEIRKFGRPKSTGFESAVKALGPVRDRSGQGYTCVGWHSNAHLPGKEEFLANEAEVAERNNQDRLADEYPGGWAIWVRPKRPQPVWIPWDYGNGVPVEDGTEVECLSRHGQVTRTKSTQDLWLKQGIGFDITAYRVVSTQHAHEDSSV